MKKCLRKVYPTADGIVKYADRAMGYTIVIQHELPPGDPRGEYICSVYYHLKMPPPDDEGIKWTPGQKVFKTDPIGYISGKWEDHRSIPHLHFGIRKDKYIPGKDKRTEVWYYPGYTTIYKDGVPQCDSKDPVHQLILAEWFDPCDFLSKYLEPSQKFTLGDYVQTTVDLRIRKCAGLKKCSYDIILPEGSVAQVVADEDNGVFADGYYWWYVQFKDKPGWCAEEFLEECSGPPGQPGKPQHIDD